MCLPMAVRNPEIVLAQGKFLGYEWVVVKNGHGFRCGYVRVDKDHPWYGKEYDDIDVRVHGGLTFCEKDLPCHKGKPDDGYWAGFDCAHGGDAKDPSIMTEEQIQYETNFNKSFYDLYPEYRYQYRGEVIRDQKYVEKECRSLCLSSKESNS